MNTTQTQLPTTGDVIVTMKTSMGTIKIKLFPQMTPKTVENFTTHAKNGYYDGVGFHRIIQDFMIQGGDPDGTGMGGESIWGKSFGDEFVKELTHIKGALSMANAGPNTNGSQFFIVHAQEGTPHLNGRHSVFGQVFEGMDVVDAIAKVAKDRGDRPTTPVLIETIITETVA
ncbi:MAG: peptidylprolyl isomerase [Oscillospiraceae bacterium]